MFVNPVVADAMKRAGEKVPETGIIALSSGSLVDGSIACGLNPQADALSFANELQQSPVYAWLDRYQRDFMDEKKSKACQKALAGLKTCINALKAFPE